MDVVLFPHAAWHPALPSQHGSAGGKGLRRAGKDATEDFEEIGHSNAAKEMLKKYHIGSYEVRAWELGLTARCQALTARQSVTGRLAASDTASRLCMVRAVT